jgi:hypothetical protein
MRLGPRWIIPSIWCGTPLAFLFLLSSYLADADVLTGRIYPIGASGRQPLCTWQLERDAGGSSWRSFYRTPAGDPKRSDHRLSQLAGFTAIQPNSPSTPAAARRWLIPRRSRPCW